MPDPEQKKRVLVIVGTRPELIKLAPVIHALRERPQSFDVAVCSTGQHAEMLAQMIEHFEVEINFDLKLMTRAQSLSALTARLVERLQAVVDEFSPDVILVQGDTTTAFVGGLVGFYSRIDVGHVEAGLRSGDNFSPYPEEVNRRILGILTRHHFAPTEQSQDALLQEGVPRSNVVLTGNTVIDSLLFTLERIRKSPPDLGGLESLLAADRRMVLITGHRRESFGEGFEQICNAIRDLSIAFADVDFVYPVHLNPRVQEPTRELLAGLANVHLVAPLGYVPFVRLMSQAYLILTDSGGIQEEAPTLGKPVLVMRDVTERSEAIAAGSARLVGADRAKIIAGVTELLTDAAAWQRMSRAQNPFGDGTAGQRIADSLARL